MTSKVIVSLRSLLIIIALGTVVSQVAVVPFLATESADQAPEFAYLKIPYTVVAVVILVCIEIALFTLWNLLSLVAHNEIFSSRAFFHVNTIISASVGVTVLLGALLLHVVFVAQTGPFGLVAALAAALVMGITFILLMIVMRALLLQATVFRTELAEVV